MQKRDSNNWLSFHIFRAEPHDDFLMEQIFPLVSDLYFDEHILSFFFIRYSENGPHIRLRLLCENAEKKSEVLDKVEEKFRTTFKLEAALQEDNTYPMNSIQVVPYEPELERYGANTIDMVEDHFCVSSSYALGFMNETADVMNEENALGFVFQIQMYYLHALGMDDEESLLFLENALDTYLHSMHKEEEDTEAAKQKSMDEFVTSHLKSKENMDNIFSQLWEMMNTNEITAEDHEFYASTAKMSLDMEEIYEEGLMQKRSDFELLQSKENLTEYQKLSWPIYIDLFHLLNNRMGFSHPANEAFLLYGLKESLKGIMEKTENG